MTTKAKTADLVQRLIEKPRSAKVQDTLGGKP